MSVSWACLKRVTVLPRENRMIESHPQIQTLASINRLTQPRTPKVGPYMDFVHKAAWHPEPCQKSQPQISTLWNMQIEAFFGPFYPSLLVIRPDSSLTFRRCLMRPSRARILEPNWKLTWGPSINNPGLWGIQCQQAGEKETNNMSIRKNGKGCAVRYSVLNVACFLVQKGREAHKISGVPKGGGNTKKYTSQQLHLFVFLGRACEYSWTIIKKDARLSMWNWSFIGQFQLSSSLTITICTSSWFLERFKFFEFSSPKSAIWRMVSWCASYTEVLMHLAPSSFLTASLISPW